ncbi:hypothetical protein ACLMJK_008913 [Lecanora helva]
METSSDNHMYLTVGDPYLSSLQLFYTLIGKYTLSRIAPRLTDRQQCLTTATNGTSTIEMRATSSLDFDLELIQTTVLYRNSYVPQTLPAVHKYRAIRLSRLGIFSIWQAKEDDQSRAIVVGEKVYDLEEMVINHDYDMNWGKNYQVVSLETKYAAQKRITGGEYFTLVIWLGPRPRMRLCVKSYGAAELIEDFWPRKETQYA